MSHDDFDFEPRRGLPALLPAGERLLWQGSPQWRQLAVRAYHIRKVAIYFGALILWRLLNGIADHQSIGVIASGIASLAALALAAVGILSVLASLSARSAVFSITSRRILIRHGIAVPMTLNLPFKAIAAADISAYGQSSGDIVIRTVKDQRVGYLVTWPFLRPARFAHPEPSLRAIAGVREVAAILVAALEGCGAAADASPEGECAPQPVRLELPRATAA